MLHVAGEIHPYTMGGIGVHVHDLCKDLTKLNQQITVYTTLPKYPQEINLGFEVVDFHRYITIAGNIIALNMIPSLFKNRYSFDVIHAHSHLFFSTVLCACMRKIGSSPLIITNHGFQSQSAPKWLQKIYLPTVAKWTLNSADKILCYTNSAKQELIDAGIKASYGTLCSHIVNRTGDGMCPVEELTQQITDAEEAYILIKQFLIEKQIINR